MKIALIANDKKKSDMIEFTIAYEHVLRHHTIFATGTTGKIIEEATKLSIHKFQSGPLGGDQQIGSLVANNEMDMIMRSEEHTSELQSRGHLVCRLLLEKKKKKISTTPKSKR